MTTNSKTQKVLDKLEFDFSIFTISRFIQAVGEKKGREIITFSWEMPPTMFGAWISDAEEPKEYIFYRRNLLAAHQIHIQLHELSHFLLGHPTLQFNRLMLSNVLSGTASLPIANLPKLRSLRLTEENNMEVDDEVEAEALTHLIQKRAIQNSKINALIHHTSSQEQLSAFLKKMSLP